MIKWHRSKNKLKDGDEIVVYMGDEIEYGVIIGDDLFLEFEKFSTGELFEVSKIIYPWAYASDFNFPKDKE